MARRIAHGLLLSNIVLSVLRCQVEVNEAMELNSVEAIVALVRQDFGISIVPKLANVDFDNDKALRVATLEGVDVRRHVGLIERVKHSRMAFTEAIKGYFAETQT